MTATVAPAIAGTAVAGRRFYVRMAGVCVVVALLGFAPTYWMPVVRGSLHVSPIVHVHAALFFGWTFFFYMQARLAALGNVTRHMERGVAGVALVTAMLFVASAAAINSIKHFDATGFSREGRVFSLVSFSAIALFVTLFGVAVANFNRPEIHKRLMLIATASILPAAIGRWFTLLPPPPGFRVEGPPPPFVTVAPSILADLLIVAGMVYDRRTRRAVHPVYWITGAVLVVVQFGRVFLGGTDAWLSVTNWIVALSP